MLPTSKSSPRMKHVMIVINALLLVVFVFLASLYATYIAPSSNDSFDSISRRSIFHHLLKQFNNTYYTYHPVNIHNLDNPIKIKYQTDDTVQKYNSEGNAHRSLSSSTADTAQIQSVVAPAAVTSSSTTTSTTVFYAMGDQPYSSVQSTKVKKYISSLPSNDGTFLIHVGDIRRGKRKRCTQNEFTSISSVLQSSPIPVFIIPGDNEWEDCSNRDEAQTYWRNEFENFYEKYWSNTKMTTVKRKSNSKENFSFIKNDVLFIGLNIIGGKPYPNRSVWDESLREKSIWAKKVMKEYKQSMESQSKVGRIVLFIHALPTQRHDAFFTPFKVFVNDILKNTIPILLIHGDKHEWIHQPNYLGLKSVLRISLVGEAKEAPLKVIIQSTGTAVASVTEAFTYERR